MLELFGLKRVLGVVIDEANRDLILFGRVDPDLPALMVEDFVVALRNAWRRYVRVEGNVSYYADPGCSIDPDPGVMRELQAISQNILQPGHGSADEGMADWERVCGRLQEVVVLGLPFDTHFAHVMVEADYDMKSQVDGTDPLAIPGLVSLLDMTLAAARDDVVHNRPISTPLSTMNRFWFYPGTNRYEEDDRIVALTLCPVTLLSHQTFVDAKGEIADAAARDPMAERFAENFSLVFSKVAAKRPIYRQLEGLFRFVALANILRFKVGSTPLATVLDYFLDVYPVAETRVKRTLPGRSAVKGFEHRQAVTGGERIFTLRLPSCGGVEVGIRVDEEKFRPSPTTEAEGVRSTVEANRPAPDAVSWTVSSRDYLAELERSQETARLNELNREALLVSVVDTKTGYRLSSGTTFYEGNDFHHLVRAVNAELDSGSASAVYLDLQDFSPDKVEAFASSSRIAQADLRPEIPIRTLSRRQDVDDSFFSPGIWPESAEPTIVPTADGFATQIPFTTAIPQSEVASAGSGSLGPQPGRWRCFPPGRTGLLGPQRRLAGDLLGQIGALGGRERHLCQGSADRGHGEVGSCALS